MIPLLLDTPDPASRYASMLWHATTLDKLKEALRPQSMWSKLADDAIAAVRGWTDSDFERWRLGLRKEHRKVYAGDDWAREFAIVLLPARMVQATMVAEQFHVPWALAWKRIAETASWWPERAPA